MKAKKILLRIKNYRNQKKNCEHFLTEVKLKGGFGNQLFQFATGVSIALENKTDIYFHDLPPITNDPLNIFGLREIGIEPEIIYQVSTSTGSLVFNEKPTKIEYCASNYTEKNFSYIPVRLQKNHNLLDGYFQSYKYFEWQKEPIQAYLKTFFELDSKKATNEFIIQVRLGDLLSNPEANKIHGIIPSKFVEEVIAIADSKKMIITVVTDDATNATKVFKILGTRKDIEIVSESAISDFKAMVNAKNLAISNSTFGWWAGWIGDAEVYAPSKWFVDNKGMNFDKNDFFPNNWIIL
jgi:hypothetical protein